jgi:hypothetical protein
MMMHEVKLEGSNTAILGGIKHVNNKGGAIGPLLRKAIGKGVLTPECMVTVTRDGRQVFLPCKAKTFSGYTISETDRGLVRKKFVPYESPHWE